MPVGVHAWCVAGSLRHLGLPVHNRRVEGMTIWRHGLCMCLLAMRSTCCPASAAAVHAPPAAQPPPAGAPARSPCLRSALLRPHLPTLPAPALPSPCCVLGPQALVFVTRTIKHSFADRAGGLTYIAFFVAQVGAGVNECFTLPHTQSH